MDLSPQQLRQVIDDRVDARTKAVRKKYPNVPADVFADIFKEGATFGFELATDFYQGKEEE